MSVTVDGDKTGSVPHRVRQFVRGPRPESVPALVGGACAVVGLIDVAAGVFPRFRHSRMHTVAEVLPGALGPFAAALSLSAGMLLLLLAHGLKRHKRRAWRAAVVLLPAGAVAQFAYRHSIVGVLVSLTLCYLLVRHRSEFRALPDPGAVGGHWPTSSCSAPVPSCSVWSSSASTPAGSSGTRP